MSELTTVTEEPRQHSMFVTVAVFVLYWAGIGYILGTVALIGPVRWYVDKVRAGHMGTTVETAGVIVAILIVVIISALFARLAFVITSESTTGLVTVPLVVLLGVAASYALWMHPALFSREAIPENSTAHFVFGPYPDEEQLRELKARGFIVVSLLSPAVVPFEPKLLSEETESARRIGIELLKVPMLPWVSSNADALRKIRELAGDKRHRFYVHCYLGKNRVQLARQAVESVEGTMGISLTEIDHFERGRIHKLGKVGWVVPYPTPEEMGSYILTGEIRQVVALLDPSNADEKRRIIEEEETLKAVNMPFLLIPVPADSYDPALAGAIVAKLKTLPRPVAVHAFLSPESGKARWAEGVLSSFESGAPALPASLFEDPLSTGSMKLAGTRLVIGPEPQGRDVWRLWNCGIRKFVSIGRAPSADLVAAAPDANWSTVMNRDEAISLIRQGGTIYLFGGDRSTRSDIEDEFE